MTDATRPTVSVVIPTYKRAETLRRAVDSALEQTWTDLEVVIVDDHSEDGTEDVVAAIDDSRVRFLQHEVNQGGNAARRTAITASRGSYIAFLDADDLWYPTKIERQLEAIRASNGSAGFAYTWYEIELPDGSVLPGRRPTQGGFRTPDLLRSNFVGTFSSVLVERAALDDVGGPDPAMPACQDWEFYLRVNQVTGIVGVPEVLTRYWQGDADPHRISSSSAKVAAGHREVYRRNRARIALADRDDAIAGRRYFLEMLANAGDTHGVARVIADVPPSHLTWTGLRFLTHMSLRVVRKRYGAATYGRPR